MAKKRAKKSPPPASAPLPPAAPPAPNPEELSLLRAVAAEPEIDSPRLVYADWCDENGQPERAEFIRLQIDRSRRPFRDRAHHFPTEREVALETAHRERWLSYVAPMAPNKSLHFERGFPT